MSHQLWSQDVFTKGEISPLMYARVSVAPYYNGLKTAKNVITFPQGAAGKRFGTYFQNFLTGIAGITSANDIFFKSMQYLNECVYLIVILPNQINIYLEGTLAQVVTGSPIGSNLIRSINYTVLDNAFRVTTGILAPQEITRSPDSPITISNFNTSTNVLTLASSPYLSGQVLPIRFSYAAGGGNAIFGSTPQVLTNKTYFAYFLTSNTFQIYSSATEAKFQLNPFVLLNSGTGTQNAVFQNTWAINPTKITTFPTFDFGDVDYSAYMFTPGGMGDPNAVTITATPPSGPGFFSNTLIGGLFFGGPTNPGIGRILSVTSPTVLVVTTISLTLFTTQAILGKNAILSEPAWSTLRGWPRVCSSFQNRAFFANTDLLPNGLWGSVTNDFYDFDDSEVDDDNAISWFPTSDDINYIRFIVPYRSLTVHTNSGVFSTPLSTESAITPTNFSLTLQDSTPAESVQPRGIDNQIVILSGNDAHSLLWDGFNNAYNANIISVANEQLIRDPVDEAAYVDLTRAGSRYMLIVNTDGSLALYQTLIAEDVQGFTPAYLEQTYGNAYFRWVTTSTDGRGWFVTERQLALNSLSINITGYTSSSLHATASNISLTVPTAIQFLTSGALPASTPTLQLTTWYWALGVDADNFNVYATQADALAGINQFQFTSSGTSSEVSIWALETQFCIEELSFNAKMDCSSYYNGSPTDIFNNSNIPNGVGQYNAQGIYIQGDGYGFSYTGINATVETIAHGMPTNVSLAQFGFPINVEIEPLPLSIFGTSTKQSNLLTPKHIREASFMFADTIGGFINDVPIALSNFNEVPIGSPPIPVNGIFEYGAGNGWDDYKSIGFTIYHSEPFDFKLIGIFYRVDI